MYLKKINETELNYHLFKISPTKFVLFDDEMDAPIQLGSIVLIKIGLEKVFDKVSNPTINIYDKRNYSFILKQIIKSKEKIKTVR